MFFLTALTASLAYSLQNVLMAKHYRSMDTLSSVAYRGLTLGISMAPILVFVPRHQFGRIFLFIYPLLGATVLTALGNWAMAKAFRHLSVGIANTLMVSFITIVSAFFSYLFYHEVLSFFQIVLIAAVFITLFWLGASKSSKAMPAEFNVRKGIGYAFLFGLLLGGGITLIGMTSRTLHPFLVGYFWEFSVGITAAVMAFIRGKLFHGVSLVSVNWKQFWIILYCAAPTAIGTGFFALSMTMGPVAVAAAITSTTMVFTTLLAFYIYGEQLSLKQWLLLLLVCALVVGLKLVSD
ncbi:DMT family transporter [candidate division KSB1 bacterium]|nr:DMT family transporter [candidate division KSB1 bacterium]